MSVSAIILLATRSPAGESGPAPTALRLKTAKTKATVGQDIGAHFIPCFLMMRKKRSMKRQSNLFVELYMTGQKNFPGLCRIPVMWKKAGPL